MKTIDEMRELILKTAEEDERIRAVTMEGSNVTEGAVHDKYSDIDVTFFVTDIREFTKDKDYMKRFGDILIMQMPDDWYAEPYDYNSRNKFAYLVQYKDGNRIDMTFIDISNIGDQVKFNDPRVVMINKDNFPELKYIAFMKMMNLKVGIDNGFEITTGGNSKYLKKYLSPEEMERFKGIFAKGEYEDMWDKLFLMYDYFEELSVYVAEKLAFHIDLGESRNVREFMEKRRREK